MKRKLVVDCSVMAKAVLPEPGGPAAAELIDRYQSGEIDLIAPDLLMAEAASLLAKKVRRKLMSAEEAMTAFADLTEIAPNLIETRPLLPEILELSIGFHLSFWDCAYVAVAMQGGCGLITADLRMYTGLSGRDVFVEFLGGDDGPAN